jgi:RimJ/RimL family protein N-acetyltransferase
MDATFAHALCAPLATARLRLLPLTAAHARDAWAPMQDDALYTWMSARKPASVDALEQNWKRLESRLSPNGQQAWPTWAVVLQTNGALLGRVDAVVEPDGLCSNFGYYLFPPHWGQGYASEAVQAAANHLLAQGVHRLVATVTVGNHASERVLQKAGFVLTRILPNNDELRGVWVDDAEYVRQASIGPA